MTQINSRRRAMTLIEILVVVAVGLLVVGLVLEAMIGTNRATDELTAREGMRQEALLIAQSVEKVARYRVAPTELAPEATAGVAEQFGPSQLRLCSLANGADKDRLVQTVANLAGADQAQHVVTRASGGTDADKAPTKRLGSNSDRFRSDIAFRYASDYRELEPVWADQATSTPKLIEYTVRVWPNSPKMGSFEAAQDSRGRGIGFRLTGAVKLP